MLTNLEAASQYSETRFTTFMVSEIEGTLMVSVMMLASTVNASCLVLCFLAVCLQTDGLNSLGFHFLIYQPRDSNINTSQGLLLAFILKSMFAES